MSRRGPHDMGGLPAGKVERTEHDYAEWERRIDAMAVLLWGQKGARKYFTVDEHRNAIESLPPADYDRLSYYEKWIHALTRCMVNRGVVSDEELSRKMAEVQKRG